MHPARLVLRTIGFATFALGLVPLPAPAQTIEIVRSFEGPPAQPSGGLVAGPDGAFYGTSGGGAYRAGTVYKITPSGEVTILHSFTGGSGGSGPRGGLVRVGDDFYGTTSTGGVDLPTTPGTVFRISSTGSFETIFRFSSTNGSRPLGTLTLGSDGRLYGTTSQGGSAGAGTLYRINLDGSGHEVLHHFGTPAATGGSPQAGVVEGEPGIFYGVASSGGASSRGTIYSWSEATGHVVVNSFASDSQPGSPLSELFRDSAGNLWGTTALPSCGAIFKRLASTGQIVTVHLFGCNQAGASPSSPLVPDAIGRLWGTTAGGFPPNSGATVYRVDPATNAHSVVHVFSDGQVFPRGRPLVAVDGRVYGTTEAGSDRPDQGGVFRIDPVAGDAFDWVRAFGFTEDGWEPNSLTAGADGALYGTARRGGGAGAGTAFRIDPDGSFETLHAFEETDLQGSIPGTTRVISASDGMLYGTSSGGGSFGGGRVFSMTAAGLPTVLFSFQTTFGHPNGTRPHAALVEGSDGDLYGTTVYSGASGWGTVFRITKTGTLTTLATLSGVSTGSEPLGRLVEGSDGRFYGTAFLNGWNGFSAGWGSLFSVAPTPGSFRKDYQFFDGPGGYSPDGGMIEARPGKFMGGARGGAFGQGVLFELTPGAASPYRIVHHFAGGPSDGAGVSRELVRGSDGFLYGTTIGGGVSLHGTVFRIQPDGSGYEVVHFFTGPDGSRADGLVPGIDGNIYGITALGGPNAGGVLFRVRLAPLVGAGGPYSVLEGGSVELAATCNRAATFEWDLDDDGEFDDATGQTVSFSAAGLDDSDRPVKVRATDEGGLSDVATATVHVTNAPPTVDAGPDVTLIAGQSLVRAGSFSDPGVLDTWTASVSYGDGSGTQPLALGDHIFNLTHAFSTAGSFTVTVTVVDDDDGVGNDTVLVQVRTVVDSIQGLIAGVQELVDRGILNYGQGNSMIGKLEGALNQLGKGNVGPAINMLQSFVNEVSAFIQSGKLTPAEGQPLLDAANAIIAALMSS